MSEQLHNTITNTTMSEQLHNTITNTTMSEQLHNTITNTTCQNSYIINNKYHNVRTVT